MSFLFYKKISNIVLKNDKKILVERKTLFGSRFDLLGQRNV
jgi:hypothetical protein